MLVDDPATPPYVVSTIARTLSAVLAEIGDGEDSKEMARRVLRQVM